MTDTAQRLYDLLPAIYRIRDAERGGVLRELVELIAGQVDVLAEDLDQMYDDLFIETCARWAAPYIGDLVGYRVLHGVVPEVASPRAEVANTIRYRRRKGTASMLEQMARDVTGWPARAVEFFERLATTQYMNHVRRRAAASADLRATEALSWVTAQGGAFSDLAHTADVRRICAQAGATRGRYNIPNVGIFLWRTDAVRLTRSPLVPHTADGRRFRFDALGSDTQLFGAARTEEEITHLAEPYDVPLPLGRRWLSAHLGAYYGIGRSLLLETVTGSADPVPVLAAGVRICDLSDVPGGGGAWAHEPPAGAVAIDPVLGRVFFGTALPAGTTGLATYHYGESVPAGAGGRTRGEVPPVAPVRTAAGGEPLQPHLDAVAAGGTLRLTDTSRFTEAPAVRAQTPTEPAAQVVIRACDHQRPVLAATAEVKLAMQARSTVVIDGLLIAGGPVVLEESADKETRTIIMRNCTLVPGQARTSDGLPAYPGRASLLVLHPFADVRLDRCVVGPIVAVEGSTVTLTDCVLDACAPEAVAFCGRAEPGGGALRVVSGVAGQEAGDGTEPGGHLQLTASTVVGGIHATVLDASNSILLAELATGDPRLAAVWARRRQEGCVRYSFVPEGSRTGRRFACQPDPDDPPGTRRAARPRFTSLRFGDHASAQLRADSPGAIRRGADDASEMGATHLLYTPQREANLLLRLDEYLRFGLEAGFFYAT